MWDTLTCTPKHYTSAQPSIIYNTDRVFKFLGATRWREAYAGMRDLYAHWTEKHPDEFESLLATAQRWLGVNATISLNSRDVESLRNVLYLDEMRDTARTPAPPVVGDPDVIYVGNPDEAPLKLSHRKLQVILPGASRKDCGDFAMWYLTTYNYHPAICRAMLTRYFTPEIGVIEEQFVYIWKHSVQSWRASRAAAQEPDELTCSWGTETFVLSHKKLQDVLPGADTYQCRRFVYWYLGEYRGPNSDGGSPATKRRYLIRYFGAGPEESSLESRQRCWRSEVEAWRQHLDGPSLSEQRGSIKVPASMLQASALEEAVSVFQQQGDQQSAVVNALREASAAGPWGHIHVDSLNASTDAQQKEQFIMATKFRIGDRVVDRNNKGDFFEGRIVALDEDGKRYKVKTALWRRPAWMILDEHTKLVDVNAPQAPKTTTWLGRPSWWTILKVGVVGYAAWRLNAWDHVSLVLHSLGVL